MSTIDTRLSNLNIWEGTEAQIESAGIGENDIAFITDGSFEEKFRYNIMPLPSVDYNGQIVQYIGATNSSYTEGAFYKCVAIESHIDTISSGIGLTLSFIASTGMDTFESFCEDNDSDCAYMEITGFNSPYSPTKCVVTSYTASGIEGGYTNSGADFTEIIPEMGLAYSNDGRIGTSDKFRVYRVSYRWDLIEVPTTMGFRNIVGDPRDNAALDTTLNNIENQAIIQVTELPEITEDTKDRIYQYVGEDDFDNQLYTGSFYKAYGSTYELDTENSQLIDDMSFVIIDESKFLSLIRDIYSDYPALSDQSYLDIVFYGTGGEGGYGNAWWIDPSVRPGVPYCPWNEKYSREYGGIQFYGTPTIIASDNSDPTSTPNTFFHFLITKPSSDYQYWHWVPLSIYPYQNVNSDQVLVNKSRFDTSIIEKNALFSDTYPDGPSNTVIGVDAGGNSGGGCTAFGYGAKASMGSAAIGANSQASMNSATLGYQTHAYGSDNVAVGCLTTVQGQYCVAVGKGINSSGNANVVVGYLGTASGLESISIGRRATATGNSSIALGAWTETTGEKSIALGWSSYATQTGAVQLGEGRNDTAFSLQFRNYQLVNASGMVPYERLASNTPQNNYCLVYQNGSLYWRSVLPDIPVTQESTMPAATSEERTVQYVGESDGTYVEGYFYKETYNEDGDYWYWRRLNTQPSVVDVSYNDVTDKPAIDGVTLEGDLDLVEDLGVKRVALTGSYADLTTKPGINGHALLANTTSDELEISYNDLTDKPMTLPSLPSDSDQFDYVLRWDHTLGTLVWDKVTAEEW